MAEKTFPARQRCKTCRGKLDETVLSGLFCSYRCAGHPAPATDPAKAPRECAYPRDGKPVFKRRFRCESEIPATISSRPDVSVYRCSHCLFIHTGTAVARTVHERKSVRSMEELALVLTKARGSASVDQVAKAARIRPIRVREIESCADRIDPAAMFALARVYRMDFSVGFR